MAGLVGDGPVRVSDLINDDGAIQGIIRQLVQLSDNVDALVASIQQGAKLSYAELKTLAKDSAEYNIILQEELENANLLYKAQEQLRRSQSDYAQVIAEIREEAKANNKETQLQVQMSNAVAGSINKLKLEIKELTNAYNAADAAGRKALAPQIRAKSAELASYKAELKGSISIWTQLNRAADKYNNLVANSKGYSMLARSKASYSELKRLLDQLADSTARLNLLQTNKANFEQLANTKEQVSLKEQLISLQAKMNAMLTEDGKELARQTSEYKMQKELLEQQLRLQQLNAQTTVVDLATGQVYKDASGNTLTNAQVQADQQARIKMTQDEAKAQAAATEEMIRRSAELAQQEEDTTRRIRKAKLQAIVDNDELGKSFIRLEAEYELNVMAMEELDTSTNEGKQRIEELTLANEKLTQSLNDQRRAMGKSSQLLNNRQRAWNGLTNATNQIVRELPTLGLRVDMFFLAISNNIPIFIDEINLAVKAYVNAGKTMKEARKAAWADSLKTLVSWQTLIIILLSLLTQFSKIKNAVQDFFSVTDTGAWKTTRAYQKLAEAVKDTTKKYGEQMAQIAMLKRAWDKTNPEDREKFLVTYREELDNTGYAIRDVNEAERLFGNYTGVMVQALAARAKATAALSLAQKEYSDSVAEMANVEAAATKLLGKPTAMDDLQKSFGDYYGLTKTSFNTRGSYAVSKEMLLKIATDYVEKYRGSLWLNEKGLYVTSTPADIGSRNTQTIRNMVTALNTGGGPLATNKQGLFDVPLDVMVQLAVTNQLGKKAGYGASRQLRRAAENIEDANAKAEQFVDIMVDNIEAGKGLEESIGLEEDALIELEKKVRDLDLKSLKALNDQLLNSMGNYAYERGGVDITIDDETTTVKSSFDKGRVKAKLDLGEVTQYYDNLIEDAKGLKAKKGMTPFMSSFIDTYIISHLENAKDAATAAYSNTIDEINKDEAVSGLQAVKDNIDNRLEALNEGSELELALRKESIKKAMQLELAENAKQEPALRRSGAAIRAKYYKELERYDREYAIKRNNWLKQQLENEQEANISNTYEAAKRSVEIERLAMENELLENAELIKEGLLREEDITNKHIRAMTKIWSEYNQNVASSYKTMWDYFAELSNDNTYEQETAEIESLNLEKEIELERNRDLIEQYPIIANLINDIYEKRKKQLAIEKQLAHFDMTQEILATNFGITRQGEQATERFGLQQQRDRLVYERDLNIQAGTWSPQQIELADAQIAALDRDLNRLTATARVAEHGLIGLFDLTTEEYDAMDTWSSNMNNSLNSVIDSYVSLAEAAVASAQAQVDAAQAALDAELQARANGYANNVQAAKQELALERRKQREKESILRQAQRAQLAIDTATQVSDLITASAEILKAFSTMPYIAYAMIASLFGMFAWAKVQAYKVSNQSTYGSGGFELAVGGSHASGNDIKTGITTRSGSQMVIEGGEGVGVFSKRAVNKYGDIIPSLVDDINLGTYKQMAYAHEMTALPIYGMRSTDTSLIERKLDELIAQEASNRIVLPNGVILEKSGNVTRKIRN